MKGHTFGTPDQSPRERVTLGVIAVCAHHAVYIYGTEDKWPDHLRGYASYDPRYSAVVTSPRKLAGSISKIDHYGGKWAEDAGYDGRVLEKANALLATTGDFTIQPLRVAVAAGHHNTSGGSQVEANITDDLCELYYSLLRYQGVEAFSYTPDGPDPDDLPGDGYYAGDLYEGARKVIAFKPNLFIECHTQGGPKTPGMFGIYPDWGSDVDTEARDVLIPRMIHKMSAASGIGIWTDGVMSEKQTAVGADGFRLGVFRATEEIRSYCTRIIIEHAAHDVPSDLAKISNPDVQLRLVRAAVEAILEFYGLPIKSWDADKEPQSQTPPPPRAIELNGFEIVEGFKGFSEFLMSVKFRGVDLFWLVLGNPLENERGITLKNGQAGAIQRFERGWLIWDSNEPDVWSITLAQTRDLPQYGVTL